MIPITRPKWSPFLMDNIPEKPTSAYALFRLSSKYSNPIIRVRESGGNSEKDIGFLSNGDLNTGTILDLTASNSGYVSKVYDQSGNDHHSLQTTAIFQPRIVNAGALEVKNSRPSLRFYNGLCQLPAYKFADPSKQWSFFSLISSDDLLANNNNVAGIDGAGFSANGMYMQCNAGSYNIFFNRPGVWTPVSSGIAPSAGVPFIGSTLYTSDNTCKVALNGAYGETISSITWTTGSFSNFMIGLYNGGGAIDLKGSYSFHMSFDTISDRSARFIEAWLGRYYGITI